MTIACMGLALTNGQSE